MLAKTDRVIILHCAAKYHASSVVLFGSSLRDDSEAHDLDLGVKGVDPR